MNTKILIAAGLLAVGALAAWTLIPPQQDDMDQTAADSGQAPVQGAAPVESAAPAAAPAAAPIVLAQADSGDAEAEAEQAPARQTRFTQGEHYQRLTPTQPTSSSPDQIEVAEVFWYGCNHCYNFDPYVEDWVGKKPEGVNFVRIPAVWNPLVRLHARAFYTAEALGKGEEMHTPFFREIHVNGNALSSEAALRDFFSRFDVDGEAFKKAFDSFSVHTKLQRAETLARRYRVSSVPMVVVNGKYTTNATMTGGYDQLMEVIDELVGLEADQG